jgi:hypothetical protein
VGGRQEPAIADERRPAVAVEEGDDRRPLGLIGDAIAIVPVVANDHASRMCTWTHQPVCRGRVELWDCAMRSIRTARRGR